MTAAAQTAQRAGVPADPHGAAGAAIDALHADYRRARAAQGAAGDWLLPEYVFDAEDAACMAIGRDNVVTWRGRQYRVAPDFGVLFLERRQGVTWAAGRVPPEWDRP